MLGIALADDAGNTAAGDHLAVLANRLYAAANFHEELRKYGTELHENAELFDCPYFGADTHDIR